jgi:heme/copper-type cytochrome/quinol oxidase subunit 2
MTKVLMNPHLLGYRQDMKESLRRVVQYNYVQGIRRPERVDSGEPHLRLEEVLPPPEIQLISLFDYTGQGDDFIGVDAYHEFGIHSMRITIQDDHGNRIEDGDAYPYDDNPNLWWFFPEVRVPLGTKVVVRVTAMDCMGGFGTTQARKTLGENDW